MHLSEVFCWTLASLYSTALLNTPTPAEVAQFDLGGWNSSDWFDTHRTNWDLFVRYSWGGDLKTHLKDAFVSSADTVPLGDLPGETFNFNLWRVCRGDFESSGDFLSETFGRGFCDSYPPPPTPEPSPTPEPTPLVLSDTAWGESRVNGLTAGTRENVFKDLEFGAFNPFKGTTEVGIAYTAFRLDKPWETQTSGGYSIPVSYTANCGNTEYTRAYAEVFTTANTPLKGVYSLFEGDFEDLHVKVLLPDWVQRGSWELAVDTSREPWASFSYTAPTPENFRPGTWLLFPGAKCAKAALTCTAPQPVIADQGAVLGTPTLELVALTPNGGRTQVAFQDARPGNSASWGASGLPTLASLQQDLAVDFGVYLIKASSLCPAKLLLRAPGLGDTLRARQLSLPEGALERLTQGNTSWLGNTPGGPSGVGLPPNGGSANFYVVSCLNWEYQLMRDYSNTKPRILALPLEYL